MAIETSSPAVQRTQATSSPSAVNRASRILVERLNSAPPDVAALGDSSPRLKDSHRVEATVRCNHCSKTFTSTVKAREHTAKAHLPCLLCRLCERPFTSARDLDTHMAADHPPLIQCRFCADAFKSVTELHRHEATEHRPSVACTMCTQTFREPADLLRHEVTTHAWPLECNKCQRTFVSEHAFQLHVREKHRHGAPLARVASVKVVR